MSKQQAGQAAVDEREPDADQRHAGKVPRQQRLTQHEHPEQDIPRLFENPAPPPCQAGPSWTLPAP